MDAARICMQSAAMRHARLPIQSKALSKRNPVPLGGSLDTLRSAGWIITINANADMPPCFIMALDEVRGAAHHGQNAAGEVSDWLQPKSYDQLKYREAWNRLGEPW